MKSYTDIEQSKKLAERLPLESADMSYRPYREEGGIPDYEADLCPHRFASWSGFPCWSLAALLDYLSANFRVTVKYLDNHWELDCRVQIMYSKELVDACYEMVLKLHEQKIL